MFSTTNAKVKLPNESAPTLRCLLQGSFREFHFTSTDHRITPVHDIVFLDEVDNCSVKPLIYRPVPTTPEVIDSPNG
ncbi:uncharacterized protein LOC119666639 [Teleopsis dalmanni]|nr:uncharacterized protein LOC119666639 [Teleopsis dalmanni]